MSFFSTLFHRTKKAVLRAQEAHEKKQEIISPPAPSAEAAAARERVHIELSASSIAKGGFVLLLIAGLVLFLYHIRSIVLIFFVSLLFAAALDPLVDRMEHRKIPRALGVIIIYLFFFFILGLFFSNFIPLIATEVGDLANRASGYVINVINGEIPLPEFLQWLRPYVSGALGKLDPSAVADYKDVLLNFAQQLTSVAGNVISGLVILFNGLFNVLLVLILTFLMTIDEHSIDRFILSLFPARHAAYITAKSDAIKEKIGYWLRGQVMLSIAVGVITYIGFFILGLFGLDVKYAATLALFAGLTEIIPVVGPIIAWSAALLIVANQSLLLVFWVTVLFVIVQQLENNVLVPVIMKRAVGLSPIFVILAMLIGYEFLGVLGMILSVPVATTVALFVSDYAAKSK